MVRFDPERLSAGCLEETVCRVSAEALASLPS
jgi:hypothetical protein